MFAFSRGHRAWRQINHRRTTSLLAVEFLHGLYARHNPFLNPFRFANTAVVFTPWQTTSYAPTEEWDRLALRFGSRFLRNPSGTGDELAAVLANTRPRSRALATALDGLDPRTLDDGALMDTLTDLQHIPLGEIYEVNLVQVEHALHAAVRALVADGSAPAIGDSAAEIDRRLADLCRSTVMTVGGTEDREFLALVRRYRQGDVTDGQVRERLGELVLAHAEVGSAYGADTVSVEGMSHRFQEFLRLPEAELDRRMTAAAREHAEHRDDDLGRLLELLRRTGEVRDSNKRLLGRITRHRPAFLDEIARRRGVPADAVRLYLLEELLRLVEDGAVVPAETLRRRLTSGLVLTRRESGCWPEQTDDPTGPGTGGRAVGAVRLPGLCASPGQHTGRVRLVSSAADLTRMRLGDVLVAPGTDFDLLLLLQMAGAIVTEEGGMLSHAAVVARELRVPCLIGVADATRRLVEGQLVMVDADAGTVEVLAEEHPDDAVLVAAAPGAAPVPLLPLTADLPPEVTGRKAAGLLTLRRQGLPTPEPALLVPGDACAAIAAAVAVGDHSGVIQLAGQLAAEFAGNRVSLRSSSQLEDAPDGTAAGIYHSEVGVDAAPEPLVAAILRVLASRTGARARSYHELANRSHDGALSLLVTAYQEFTFQGTSVSHSPWDDEHVLVEYFESSSGEGCPESGGETVHFAHSTLAAAPTPPPIPHLFHDLARVAEMALRISAEAGAPVEVEWGVRDHRVVLLQARQLAPALAVSGRP